MNAQEREALTMAERELREMEVAQMYNNSPRNPELTQEALKAVRLVLNYPQSLAKDFRSTTFPMGLDSVTVYHERPLLALLGAELLAGLKQRSTGMSTRRECRANSLVAEFGATYCCSLTFGHSGHHTATTPEGTMLAMWPNEPQLGRGL